MKEHKFLSIGDVAKQFGVSIKTIRRWEEEGLILGIRTPKGHRRFPESELERLMGKIPVIKKRCAIYNQENRLLGERSNRALWRHLRETLGGSL
jgi:excisionase family DNA binding protein